MQKSEGLVEATALKRARVGRRNARQAKQRCEASRDVPHSRTILSRVRFPRHQQVTGAQAVCNPLVVSADAERLLGLQPLNQSVQDDAPSRLGHGGIGVVKDPPLFTGEMLEKRTQ